MAIPVAPKTGAEDEGKDNHPVAIEPAKNQTKQSELAQELTFIAVN